MTPNSVPNLCLAGTLDASTGIFEITTTDAVTYPPGSYNVKIIGHISGFPANENCHTFSLTTIDCSSETVSVPSQPSDPADYYYSGTVSY